MSYVRKDADFHVLQERWKQCKQETFIFTNQIELGKFLQKPGIAFPVNVTYNMQNNTPKFLPALILELELVRQIQSSQ